MIAKSIVLNSFKLGRRFHPVRFNGTAVYVADKELQSSYEGLVPRLMSIPSIFTEEETRKHFIKLFEENVFRSDKPLVAVKAFSALENPLLKKYKFDPFDFIVGAKHAIEKIEKAMSSKSSYNYFNGFSKSSDDADLMYNTMSPHIYEACSSALKSMHQTGVSMTLTDLSGIKTMITDARTHIHDEEALAKQKEALRRHVLLCAKRMDMMRVMDITSVDSDAMVVTLQEKEQTSLPLEPPTAAVTGEGKFHTASTPAVDALALDLSQTAEGPIAITAEELKAFDENYTFVNYAIPYPHGSVVASVDVHFQATEQYQRKISTESVNDEKDMTVDRGSTWTFSGCISGQEELDWRVTAIDGFSGKRHMKFVRKPVSEVSN